MLVSTYVTKWKASNNYYLVVIENKFTYEILNHDVLHLTLLTTECQTEQLTTNKSYKQPISVTNTTY